MIAYHCLKIYNVFTNFFRGCNIWPPCKRPSFSSTGFFIKLLQRREASRFLADHGKHYGVGFTTKLQPLIFFCSSWRCEGSIESAHVYFADASKNQNRNSFPRVIPRAQHPRYNHSMTYLEMKNTKFLLNQNYSFLRAVPRAQQPRSSHSIEVLK